MKDRIYFQVIELEPVPCIGDGSYCAAPPCWALWRFFTSTMFPRFWRKSIPFLANMVFLGSEKIIVDLRLLIFGKQKHQRNVSSHGNNQVPEGQNTLLGITAKSHFAFINWNSLRCVSRHVLARKNLFMVSKIKFFSELNCVCFLPICTETPLKTKSIVFWNTVSPKRGDAELSSNFQTKPCSSLKKSC